MKRLILLLAVVLMMLPSMARGYRGMFDIGAGPVFGNGKIHTSAGDYRQNNVTFGGVVSTSHGCQFNRNIFAGAGFGVLYENTRALSKGSVFAPESAPLRSHLLSIPLFVDVRWDMDIDRKITPYADLRLGYQISTEGYVMYRAESIKNSEFHTKGLMRTADCLYVQASAGARFKVGNNAGVNIGLSYIPILKRQVDIEGLKYINRGMLLLNVGFDFQGAAKSTMKEKRKDRLYRLQQQELKKQREKFDIQ